jgi:predicted GIY-YIG superfamily endonuclease
MAINGGMAVPPELAVNVERYAVYRCFADDGQLLYVGETGELGTRFASHAQKLWFTQVRGVTLEWYADELDALNAERRAIHVEHPKYNVVHRRTQGAPKAARPEKRRAPRKPQGNGTTKGELAAIRERAHEVLDKDPGITGKTLGEQFGMGARWGELRKQEHQMRNGLRAVGDD